MRNALKFKRIAGNVILSIINNNKWYHCQMEYVYKDESLKCILNPIEIIIEIIISIVVVISIVVAMWNSVWNSFSTTVEIIISIVVVISIVVAMWC